MERKEGTQERHASAGLPVKKQKRKEGKGRRKGAIKMVLRALSIKTEKDRRRSEREEECKEDTLVLVSP